VQNYIFWRKKYAHPTLFFECPVTLSLFTHSAEVDNRANRRLLELFKRQGLWNKNARHFSVTGFLYGLVIPVGGRNQSFKHPTGTTNTPSVRR
jgi:hypothetical protein